MFGLGLIVIVVALIVGGFAWWARQRALPATVGSAEAPQGGRRISLLTEAVTYIGGILLLAGGIAAIGQRWEDISRWGQVGVVAGVAAFFLLTGAILLRVHEPAIQRLVGVAWLLSAVGVAWAVLLATLDVHGNLGTYTILVVGLALTAYSAVLWLVRRHAPQNLALFAGLVITVCGIIMAVADPAPTLAFALALWGLGLVWAGLGWQRYVEPMWLTVPSGVILALFAPSIGIGEHGWVYAIAIATAAVAMAASVPLRNTPLLALGTLAMFGYVTSAVVQYFGDSLGVPAALAFTGLLIIGLAVVTTRLMRAARPHRPAGTERPTDPGGPVEAEEPGTRRPSHRHLSRTR